MLNTVHKQLLASRLKDMFVSSPLMLVYQTLGNVRSSQIKQTLQTELDKRHPDSGIQATCLKIKNTVAGASGDTRLARFLQANNILVGWQVPESSALQGLRSSRGTALSDIMQQAPSQPSAPPAAPVKPLAPAISQRTMSALIDLSLHVPGNMPVVLLAGFYKGEQVQLKHLKQWMGLDDRTTQAELLAQLDAISENLLEIGDVAEALVQCTSAAEPHDLLHALDMKAAGASDATAAAAAVQAAAK